MALSALICRFSSQQSEMIPYDMSVGIVTVRIMESHFKKTGKKATVLSKTAISKIYYGMRTFLPSRCFFFPAAGQTILQV